MGPPTVGVRFGVDATGGLSLQERTLADLLADKASARSGSGSHEAYRSMALGKWRARHVFRVSDSNAGRRRAEESRTHGVRLPSALPRPPGSSNVCAAVTLRCTLPKGSADPPRTAQNFGFEA